MGKSPETLANLVKKARNEKNISARQLAKLCDISHTEINNIESGLREKPALLTLKGFEKYLGLNFEEISRMVGYTEDTIKYGDENIAISYKKYDAMIQDYRKEIEHAAFACEQKRRKAQDIKEYMDEIKNYLDTLDNVPDNIKKRIKDIYTLLGYIDTKYEAFIVGK